MTDETTTIPLDLAIRRASPLPGQFVPPTHIHAVATTDEPGWQGARADARALASALLGCLPGSTVDHLLVALLERTASQLVVTHRPIEVATAHGGPQRFLPSPSVIDSILDTRGDPWSDADEAHYGHALLCESVPPPVRQWMCDALNAWTAAGHEMPTWQRPPLSFEPAEHCNGGEGG